MLKHADVWRAIDRLAEKHGMSPSGLARRSGLDPTTFNKSKRITKEGKQRWPSTESVAKVLTATGDSLAEFVAQMGEPRGAAGTKCCFPRSAIFTPSPWRSAVTAWSRYTVTATPSLSRRAPVSGAATVSW
jgi:hypothetical protein